MRHMTSRKKFTGVYVLSAFRQRLKEIRGQVIHPNFMRSRFEVSNDAVSFTTHQRLLSFVDEWQVQVPSNCKAFGHLLAGGHEQGFGAHGRWW